MYIEVQTSKLFLRFTVYALIKRKITANSALVGKKTYYSKSKLKVSY